MCFFGDTVIDNCSILRSMDYYNTCTRYSYRIQFYKFILKGDTMFKIDCKYCLQGTSFTVRKQTGSGNQGSGQVPRKMDHSNILIVLLAAFCLHKKEVILKYDIFQPHYTGDCSTVRKSLFSLQS